MTFLSAWNELAGTIPNLPAFLAQKYVQRAWQDVCRLRSWSFLQQTAFLVAPDLLDGGVVTVTQGSDQVVADAIASALFDLHYNDTNPPFIGRQFRVSGAGPLYTITAWDTATRTLTISDLWDSTSSSTASYQIYQAYFNAPDPNFHRFLSIYDPNQGYPFSRLHVPKALLDRRDPTRSAQGQPYFSIDFGSDVDGNPLYEFWPHPTALQTFAVTYLSQSTPLEQPADEIPNIISESCVLARATTAYAIPWAMANAGRFPQLKGINWTALAAEARRTYKEDISAAMVQDDGRNQKTLLLKQAQRLGPPIDATFLATHSWGGPGGF